MKESVVTLLEKLRLLYLWFDRILFAPDHFHTPLLLRLKLCVQGFVPDQYWLYDLKNRPAGEYLSEFDWYRSRIINGRDAYVLNNKVVCTHLLQQYVDVPALLCFRKGKPIVAHTGAELDDAALLSLLRTAHKSIFKPIDRGKGNDILSITAAEDHFLVNGETWDADKLTRHLRKKKNWFLSRFVAQGAFPAAFFPGSANTLRIITVRDIATHLPKVLFAVQRIGCESTAPVDNASQGGLIARVDLESGELSEAKTLWSKETFLQHPDTGVRICGAVVPGWAALKDRVTALAGQFPYLDFIAWDILLTDDGFTVIEANASSGVNIIQLWGGQRHGPLGDIYRHYGIIK